MRKLENKVAVITGANSGIGLATAKLFLENGAKVILTGRRKEALEEAVKGLTGNYSLFVGDVASLESNRQLIDHAVSTYGKIDILFLNAGIAPPTPTEAITEEHYDELFNINVKGPVFTVRYALPHLNDGASVLFTNSIVTQRGFDGLAVYSATKGALRAYQRVLTSELKGRKIRVNSIAPGPIETPIYGKMGLPAEVLEQMGQSFAQQVPLGRFGTSEEVAATALFLASDDASFINGIEIEVDGGLSQI